MKATGSTARLAAVVQVAGQPEAVTLWAGPKRDKDFQEAVKENRVMTVHQTTTGTRKDFGVVGFRKEKNVGYWVFPKPLDKFEGKRVVGIDYSVLKMPKDAAPDKESPADAKAKARRTGRSPKPRVAVLRTFQVKV